MSEDDLLYALQSFGELKCVHVVTLGDSADIFNFLFRNSFKINSSYVGSENNLVDGWWDAATAKDRLLEFSFGLCDKRYAARERTFRLRLKFLPPDFLKTWIQVGGAFHFPWLPVRLETDAEAISTTLLLAPFSA